MNDLAKAVLTFKFIQTMNLMSLYVDDYHKLYPTIDESNFVLGEKVTTTPSGRPVTHRLELQVQYLNKCIKLHVQKTWGDENTELPMRKYIRAIQYNYKNLFTRPTHSWVSHLGASMYYGNYTDDTITICNNDIRTLTPVECNNLLQGSTEELEFQYSTIYDFKGTEMIQFGILSLLTADKIHDTVNVVYPDLSMWENSLAGMDEVLDLLSKGILTI